MSSKWNKLSEELTKTLSPEEKNFWVILKAKKVAILFLCLSALLFVLGVNIFLSSAETLSTGLSAIPQLIIFSVPSLNLQQYYSVIFLALNLPLIFIFWNKVKRSFFVLTLFWLVFQLIWGFIIGTPVINQFLIDHTVKAMAPEYIANNKVDTWAILVFSFVGGLLTGLGVALAWKFGASSGGTDIVAYYYSTKKKINVSIPMTISALSISFISIIILSAISYNNPAIENKEIFGITSLGTVLYVLISSFLVKTIYPKYSKIIISIHSKKHEEILKMLRDINYWHGYTIIEMKSGYTGEKTFKIESVILLLELNRIKNLLVEVDPNVWISARPIKKIIGSFNSSKVD